MVAAKISYVHLWILINLTLMQTTALLFKMFMCSQFCVFMYGYLFVSSLRYLPDVTGDGLVSQINNPEVEVDIARPDVRTRQLIMELRVVTNKLRHAQSGQDMDFMDSECS